ncbi:MAG: c-type cytochrome [Acidobacteriaceae bacterium]|nr:c-type cytochrome [Acidobacteriaceae bacterium]
MSRAHWKHACAAAIWAFCASAASGQSASLPDAPGKDTVQRVCGACHPATIVLGRGMTREGWGQVVASMISRGAKGSATDFATVTDYLEKNFPPKQAPGRAGTARKGGGGLAAGPTDKQVVDPEAADRGEAIYRARCASCHGPLARGTSTGPDLVRSETVLHDRYGNKLMPYLRENHPKVQGTDMASLKDNQIKDISHFLHEQVGDTLRSGPYTKVLNVMTGNAQAGAAYFNGAGGCAKCHSITGDLAGIGSKYDPPTLQQRLLFPRTVAVGRRVVSSVKPVTVTVTPENGDAVSGTLVRMDDFEVALRDGTGTYRSWKRTPELKIQLNDPYVGHDELLDRITDTDIHNLVAYLETLK